MSGRNVIGASDRQVGTDIELVIDADTHDSYMDPDPPPLKKGI
jgi:hypothetical protein